MYHRPQLAPKRPAQRKSEMHKFDAPVAGWISNRSLSSPMSQGGAQGAAILDNFFPTSTTAVLRRGKELYATLGEGTEAEAVTAIFSYLNGLNRKLFASTASTIYDITSILSPSNWTLADNNGDTLATEDGDTLGVASTFNKEVFENALGGNWVVVQFATAGGIFLVGVNGESEGLLYDGASFYPYVAGGVSVISFDAGTADFTPGSLLTGGTSGATATIYEIVDSGTPGEGALLLTDITGTFQDNEIVTDADGGSATAASVATSVAPGIVFPGSLTTADMSYVWIYKFRLWFIEKDSLNAWYMDNVDSVGGSPEVYPLGGIMGRGGHLLWGDSWALGTGAEGGLSDQMVICSSIGEIAVFQGSYPDNTPPDWINVGVYRVGTPLGNKAHFRGGGDIAVATSVGLVPLSKAISLDVTALSPAAVSYNIQDAWQTAVDGRGLEGWHCELWPERKMAIISPPITIGAYDPVLFISNTETGAWCRYTNWDARAMEVFQGQLYFGGPEGRIYRANVTGSDAGDTYTGVYVPLFDDLGTPANRKVPKVGRGVARARAQLEYALRFQGDFNAGNIGAPPTATPVDGSNSWGTGIWGQAVWGSENPSVVSQNWKSLGGVGYSVSMSYQVTSGSSVPIDAEIVRLEMSWTMGDIVS